jgi:hypothetical protein
LFRASQSKRFPRLWQAAAMSLQSAPSSANHRAGRPLFGNPDQQIIEQLVTERYGRKLFCDQLIKS